MADVFTAVRRKYFESTKPLGHSGELDRLSITRCPEIAGGGDRLFEDGLPGTSWTLTDLPTAESGAVHMIYDRVPATGPNREGKRPITAVEIRHRAPQQAVGVRTTVPLAELTRAQGQSLRELGQFPQNRDLMPAGAPFVRYHSMSETDTDVEVGVPITGGIEAAGRVECTELPGRRAVVAVHLGAHDRLQETYGLVESRVAETGRPNGAPWEVYEWIDLTQEPDPRVVAGTDRMAYRDRSADPIARTPGAHMVRALSGSSPPAPRSPPVPVSWLGR